jgi:hypothetical protein
MASRPQYPTIVWKPGQIDQVIACIAETQKALAHFQQLFETRSGNEDFFTGKELELMSALVRTWANWAQYDNPINLTDVANQLDDEEGGGDGAGGKNVPDSPR